MLRSDTSFDIQYHDTYIIITIIPLAITLCMFLGILGVIDWLLREYKLVPILSAIHVFITIISILGIITLTLIQTRENSLDFFLLNSYGLKLIALIVFAQVIFMINIIIGLVRS